MSVRRHLAGHAPSGALPRALCLLLLCALLAACAAQEQPRPTPGNPAPDTPAPGSAFQRELDRLGVPLRLPVRGKAIVVNIPAFELIAFEDAAPVLRSRIIVGTPWNPTPRLQTHITAVRFRPTWRPTPSMVRSGEYEDKVWPPGRKNPLGLAAIRLGPGLLVYLHDTNNRKLFEQANRALSHGCIRVQRWDELVAWVLDLELAEVHRLANGRRTFDYPAPAIPVTLGYFTTFPGNPGASHRFEDIYHLGDTPSAAPAAAESCAPPPLGPYADSPLQ